MDGLAEPIDRDELMLAELAELDLSLARRVHACAMAAEDPEVVASLARGYQRIARSLRQTLALKAQLKRDGARELRENPPPAPPLDPPHVLKRCDDVRVAVRRIIWDEQEGERADYLHDLVDDRLAHWARTDAVGHRDLDGDIATMCLDFRLTAKGAAAWRDLPDPEFEDQPDDWDDPDERPPRVLIPPKRRSSG